jgi:3-hydroxy-9,10-secoandrosta-1,3,5(10)-triene-9,17-dione monooxygenase reductase component
MGVDADRVRAALSRWATGVTIVTARAGEEVHGMTVSDFAGLSLDPPLVLVCADKASNTLGVVEKGGCFAVNVLAAGQEALSNKFASKKQEWERFDGLECARAETGAPLIPGALVSIDCEVEATHEGGDHVILVGRIREIVQREGDPLIYFSGAYRGLEPAGD